MAIKKVRGMIQYELTAEQVEAIKKYLWGKMSSRQLGEALGMSHQGAISLAGSCCGQWIRQGKLVFKK